MGTIDDMLADWGYFIDEVKRQWAEDATEDEELTDHDEIVEALNTLNLKPRDIDELKRVAVVLVETGEEDMEFGAIWLSALNTYRKTD